MRTFLTILALVVLGGGTLAAAVWALDDEQLAVLDGEAESAEQAAVAPQEAE